MDAFARVVDFEMFRPQLYAALGYSDRAKGGRPPFAPVLMFKVLVIQAHNNLRQADIVIPVFCYKNHISIDRLHGFIRRWDVTDASRHDGRQLRRGLLDTTNTASTVWADSAYRSKANETFMDNHGFKTQVHRRKPRGRPMAPHIRRGNASRSAIRAAVEPVFAHQKGPMAQIGRASCRERVFRAV